MKTLLVLTHPRPGSLTSAMAREFADIIGRNGHEVEWANLAEEGFDPVMGADDEPDWDDPDKRYSPAVTAEMRRIERNEATVMFFPVYWWSVPALLKGWIDRVWNNGWAYGARSFPQRRAWMIGIAGATREQFSKRGYDVAMATQLGVGVLDYCSIEERRLEIVYGSLEGPAAVTSAIGDVRRLAAEF